MLARKRYDALRRFEAFIDLSHERHADAILSGIESVRFAADITAGQNRHIIFGLQAAIEAFWIDGLMAPPW